MRTNIQITVRALLAFIVAGVLVIAIMPSSSQVDWYSPTKILDSSYFSNPTLLVLALLLPLLVAGLVVHYSRMQNFYYDRLHSAQKESEKQGQLLEQTESRLTIAKSKIKEFQKNFDRATSRIKMTVLRLLSSNREPQDISLLDISDLNKLQEIQDSLVEIFGIESVIIDPIGERLSQSQDITGACALIRSSVTGAKECYWHQRNLGEKSFKHRRPVYKKCKACGLICGASPFIVNNRHIATWIISQVQIDNDFLFDLNASSQKMGLMPTTLAEALKSAPKMSISKFQSILELVWRLSEELSNLAFSNIQLISEVVSLKRIKPELRLARKALDQIEPGVLMFDPDGRVLAVSEPACLRLNRSRNELKSLNRNKVEEIIDAFRNDIKNPTTEHSHSKETISIGADITNLVHEENIIIEGKEYTYILLGKILHDGSEEHVIVTEEAAD